MRLSSHAAHLGKKTGFYTGTFSYPEPPSAGALWTEGFSDYNWGEDPPTKERPPSQLSPLGPPPVPCDLEEVAQFLAQVPLTPACTALAQACTSNLVPGPGWHSQLPAEGRHLPGPDLQERAGAAPRCSAHCPA